MALTPDDVVNKRFQHVKFRDGYDQDEVDDFLDEVVVELRRVYQENDDLRQKLSAAEQRVNELSQGAGAAPAQPAAVPEQADSPAAVEPQTPAAPLVAPQSSETQSAPADAQPAYGEQQQSLGDSQQSYGQSAYGQSSIDQASAATAGTGEGQQDAHGLILLAQRLHDEHLAEGERTRDRLIGDAEQKATEIVSEAEKKRDETLRYLETEKSNLERTIDGLENFERQYRTRLKSYLNDQLRDLENSGSLAPETLNGNKLQAGSTHSI